jgi:hypothetical protein
MASRQDADPQRDMLTKVLLLTDRRGQLAHRHHPTWIAHQHLQDRCFPSR